MKTIIYLRKGFHVERDRIFGELDSALEGNRSITVQNYLEKLKGLLSDARRDLGNRDGTTLTIESSVGSYTTKGDRLRREVMEQGGRH